ncbi:MAG: ABC transporter ATP-binding protein [Thermomicrobiales bacterium]|nr:ABC transporter ATP-binding protein [Thermomicrobiales bacterium]
MGQLLEVRGLRTEIPTRRGVVRAVDGVDLVLHEGEVVGLVGESGCGKTLTAYSILDLLPKPGVVAAGEIHFRGEDLRRKSTEERRAIRGNDIGMIFQEPLSALNPVFTVETQIGDVLRTHTNLDSTAIKERVVELLGHVGISAPERVARSYPFELSGGMRQRVLIAMAIACRPALLIADEPTTALDATIQAQIMVLLQTLVEEDGVSILLITHDLALVAELCDRVYVMYAGTVVEMAPVEDLYVRPRHPYTSALFQCIPGFQPSDRPLAAIEGSVPMLIDIPPGCRFADRCPYVADRCRTETPPLVDVGAGHRAACHFADSLDLPGPASEQLEQDHASAPVY